MNRITVGLLFVCFALSGCALFKRNRVAAHNGIEKDDFGLPFFLYPPKNDSLKRPSRKLVVLLSGDGGWIKFDDELALQFAKKGYITLGFNSRSYFWEQRTPEKTAEDIDLLIRSYHLKYRFNTIYLCGYSFGADVLPFVYNRLSPKMKRRVVALQLLSPFRTTAFKVHLGDLINTSNDNYPYVLDREIKKINIPTFCFYGIDESTKALGDFKQKNFYLDSLKGTHTYDEAEYTKIVHTFDRLKK